MSIKQIESRLKIPRSTLSGWLRNIKLSRKQKERLLHNWKKALSSARIGAVLWHNKQKALRLSLAKRQATDVFRKINPRDGHTLDLALAMLYLGEGFKKTTETGMGNSDPTILNFFIAALKMNYNVPISKIRCELHLRADQNPKLATMFWSDQLGIPINNFTSPSIDKRTIGKPTYSTYHGVCVIRCGDVAIQRKLTYLSKLYCDNLIKTMRA